LPVLNVDEELLNYSGYVAQQLRLAASVVRTMGIQTSLRTAQITVSSGQPYAWGGYRYGAYGWYGGGGAPGGIGVYNPYLGARSSQSQRNVVRAEERASATADVNVIRDRVATATAEIRRKMADRYQMQF